MATPPSVRVRFIGGPCGGKTKDVPALVASSGLILCSGSYYQVQPGGGSPLVAHYIAAPKPEEAPGAHSTTAYRELLTASTVTAPQQLGIAARTTRAALQRLAARGKVH